MAHNLFSQRFYSNRTQPAWHNLGINSPVPVTASEALKLVGEYSVNLAPLMVEFDGAYQRTGYSVVMRPPTADDPQWRQFGAPVSDAYELITPQGACALWDDNVKGLDGKPVAVETFGALGKGERLFMSVRLPKINVRGDEVDTYLLYDNPMEGGQALGVYTTAVRVVCQNTLTAGISGASQSRTIDHRPGAVKFLAAWLGHIYGSALKTVQLMDEAYNALARKNVTDAQVKWIVDSTYPMPKRPQKESKSIVDFDTRLERYEYYRDLVTRQRAAALGLYQGNGVGFDSEAVKGTAFGAWNAVAEFETYRRGKIANVGMKLVNGDRAHRIKRAYALAMQAEPI